MVRQAAVCALVIVWGGIGAAQAPSASAAFPTFQAVSIRVADRREPLDIEFFPGRFVAIGATLETLIEQAYGIEAGEVAGGPDWIRNGDRFDVDANAGNGASNSQMLIMLRALLADRFKLEIDQESRMQTTYTLTRGDAHGLRPPADPGDRPRVSTKRESKSGSAGYVCEGRNATLKMLADDLEDELHAPVADKTDDRASYDFNVSYPSDPAQAAEALAHDLGVTLVAGQGPVDVWAIHAAAKPKTN